MSQPGSRQAPAPAPTAARDGGTVEKSRAGKAARAEDAAAEREATTSRGRLNEEAFMLFVITALDRPGALERRLQVRPAHLEYLKTEAARIKAGGPILNENEQPIGSLLIIEADDRQAAEALADADPYRREGVFERVDIRAWRAALGTWAA